jgi:ribonuclease P protein component
MLKKENRLTKNNDFDNVFKRGRSAYFDILGVKAVPNSLNTNHFGIIVSNKVSKKAVERNKIKRQIRAIIENELFLLNVGYDIVIIVFKPILAKNYEEIKAVLWFNFRKLRLYKK